MAEGTDLPKHPIRVVSRRTGLSSEVIRAWELRYQVVTPGRSASGRRLYSDAEVERLVLLARAVAGGRSIGHVAPLATEQLAALVSGDEAARADQLGMPSTAAAVEEAMDAVGRLDGPRLEAVLRLTALRLPVVELVEQVIAPLMRRVGDAWHSGALGVGHEHLASALVRSVVSSLARGNVLGSAPQVVVAAPAGQQHEIGALSIAAAASSDGWRVLYLGADTPVRDIAAVARQTACDCICLSISCQVDAVDLSAELRQLRAALPQARIFAGGRAAEAYHEALAEIGAMVIGDSGALRPALNSVRRGAA